MQAIFTQPRRVAMKMAVAVEKTVQARAERTPTNTLFQRFSR